jgi:beta-N-acetylhexosaminidase
VSTPAQLPLGPVMVDVAGTELSAEDRTRLLHPNVGAVILFARNYADPAQLAALTAQIASLRSPRLPIAVDQEGGRVQRFRAGFTRLPAMAIVGQVWERDPDTGLALARAIGEIIGSELSTSGVDFSFAPVLDLAFGPSKVIGDRAFHRDPRAVSVLAEALMAGLNRYGMLAVGKHFPGHGFVAADSHTEIPVDDRSLTQIEADDLVPYKWLIPRGLAAIMPAHVIYPRVDAVPAGFSRIWLRDILRSELGFEGTIFSDDLSMAAAGVAGDIRQRARAALEAGCDMVLVCNAPAEADRLLAQLEWTPSAQSTRRLSALSCREARADPSARTTDPGWVQAQAILAGALGTAKVS